MNSESKSIQEFSALVARVVPEIRERGGAIVGAVLGNLLKREDPGFGPAEYGAERLVDLLEQIPELGRVVREPGRDVRFELAGHVSEGSVGGGISRLHPRLWNALVAPQPEAGAFVDLAFGRVVYCQPGQVPDGMAEDPARFVAIDGIDQEIMRGWAVEFARDVLGEKEAERTATLEAATWFPVFVRRLSPDRRAEWLAAHQRRVLECWTAWAGEHGIDPRRGLFGPGSGSRPRHPGPGRSPAAAPSDQDLTDLRAALHRAVDAMSRDELLSLQVPVRYIWRGGED